MKLILKTIWTVVILVMMNNGVAQEIHDTDHHELIWFSTSTSALLNRSSTEMATKHISRGMRLARQALLTELNVSDQLIANHNLCVGFLSSDEAETAKPYCARATELAQQPFNLFKIRGAYFLSEKAVFRNAQVTNSLFHTVLGNIDLHDSQIRLSLFKE